MRMAVDPTILDIVAARPLPRAEVAAGEALFFQGEAAGRMYVVQYGAIEVLMFGRVLERIGPGGIVGEMGLVDASPRSAAALATAPSTLIEIDREAFAAILRETPHFALAVMAVMAGRLRRTGADAMK